MVLSSILSLVMIFGSKKATGSCDSSSYPLLNLVEVLNLSLADHFAVNDTLICLRPNRARSVAYSVYINDNPPLLPCILALSSKNPSSCNLSSFSLDAPPEIDPCSSV